MKKHFQLTDAQFEVQFADCSLDPKPFSHLAHIRLAWTHISNYGVNKAAIQEMSPNFIRP